VNPSSGEGESHWSLKRSLATPSLKKLLVIEKVIGYGVIEKVINNQKEGEQREGVILQPSSF
jgi:hypothetical protein